MTQATGRPVYGALQIRFKNTNGYGPYSDAKTVLVAIWVPTERTRNRTETDWVDTGRTQTDPVEDFDEKEQRRLVTYEQEEELRPNPDNEPNRWVLIREFEYQWVPIQDPPPPPLPPPSNVTASATHNSVTVSWDTVQGATGYVLQLGELEEDEEIGYVNYTTTQLTHTVGNLKSRTRYYYRVKSKNAGGEGSPSAVASLVTSAPPPPPVTHSYRDITPAVYSGCGPNRRRKQECVRLGHEDTRWRSASEPLRWGDWRNVGSPQLISGTCKQRKERSWTRSQRQQSRSHCEGTKFQSVTTTGTEFNYDSVSETWGSWSYTGGTDYDDIEDVIYYEQERFSSPCGRRQTKWVTTRP